MKPDTIPATRLVVDVPKDDCGFSSGSITLEAAPSGRKAMRGTITIVASDWENDARVTYSPTGARRLAIALLELADKAERFTTAGFLGSDETEPEPPGPAYSALLPNKPPTPRSLTDR